MSTTEATHHDGVSGVIRRLADRYEEDRGLADQASWDLRQQFDQDDIDPERLWDAAVRLRDDADGLLQTADAIFELVKTIVKADR